MPPPVETPKKRDLIPPGSANKASDTKSPNPRDGSPSIFESKRTSKANRSKFLSPKELSKNLKKCKEFRPKKSKESLASPQPRELSVKIKKKTKQEGPRNIPEFLEKDNTYMTAKPIKKRLESPPPPNFFVNRNSDEILTSREESPQKGRPGTPPPIGFFKMGRKNKKDFSGSLKAKYVEKLPVTAVHRGPIFPKDENIASSANIEKAKISKSKLSTKPSSQTLLETMKQPKKPTKRSGSPLPLWDMPKKRFKNIKREFVMPLEEKDEIPINRRPDLLCLPDKLSASLKKFLKSFVTVHNSSVADIRRFGKKVAYNAQKETIVSLHKNLQIDELTKQ